MKKLTLFLVAMLFSTLSFAALNPYAYGLKSDLSLDESTLTVNYSLNADATGVNIVILNGETVVKTIACDGKTKGSYTVEVPTTDFPKSTLLTWKLEVSGTSVATPTKQTTTFSFYLPYSMDVDVDTESDYFGRWYVIEATNGGQGKSGYHSTSVGRGLYAFDAALEPIKNNSGTYGFTGGMTLGATETNEAGDYINLSCVTTSGGRVFVGRFRSGYAPILEATDLHSTDYPIILSSAGGRAIALDAKGSGENLQLVMLGTDYSIKEYDLGAAASWGTPATPSRTVNTTGLTIERKDAAITYDKEGGLWVNQNSASNPTIAHLSTSGLDYDNISAGLSHILGEAKYNIRGAAINQEGTELAVPAAGRGKVTVFTISKDSEGKISLTQKYTITTGNNNTALSYDYAGNLYIANRSAETISFYAMPYDGEVSTRAASKYAFQLTEVVPEVYTVTVEKVGEGTIEGDGEYLENSTVTLKATPAEHYEFIGWTGDVTSDENPLTITVNSDLTVTANFAEKKYTLTALTNDVAKGTVSGAGSYKYGTEVTLTATPKEGYKLLYWSDRSKESTRTITMNKNEALLAYFVKDEEESTFTIQKVWENAQVPTATADGYQAVGWDGKIYMQNKTAGTIQVFSNGTDAAVDYATSGTGQQIAIDEAGNLIVFNAYFATATPNAVLIYKKGSTEGTAVPFTLKAPARCDFFSASGDIYSAEGGYVYFYCAGKTVINRLKITNGAATETDVMTDVVGESVYSSPQNTNYVMVDIFGNLVAHARSNAINAINVYTNETKSFALPSIKMGTLGGCSFELGGKELWAYHAGATNYSSEWNIYNMTDSKFLSDTVLYAIDKTNSSNNACNWLNVQVIDENTAYIYQFCPKKAAAVWKVTRDVSYTVSATATNGTVSGTGVYKAGTTATLTATPNTGYKFINWTKGEDVVSTEATYSFTVSEDVALVANFEALPKTPRAWAYNLKRGEEGDNYTFTFTATAAGQATILFEDVEGNPIAPTYHEVGAIEAGEKTVVIAKSAFEGAKDVYWSVKMDGAPIEGVVEITDASKGIYNFYLPQGVVVDNNPESKTFGTIFVAESTDGASDGGSDRAKAQKRGIFVYDQTLAELNPTSNVGILPSNVTLENTTRNALKRIAINPKTNEVAFAYNATPAAVWAVSTENVAGEATNMLDGLGFEYCNSLCFGEDGTLYVFDNGAGYPANGSLYKIVAGEAIAIFSKHDKYGNADNSLVADGHGGLWISQNRGQLDGFNQLAHVNANGEIDFEVNSATPNGFESLSTARGALAYNPREDILAIGIGTSSAIGVSLYHVEYHIETGVPTLEFIGSVPALGKNVDGIAFDYAGDLYAVSANAERMYKFALPSKDNICTVPAPESEAIKKEVRYTVTVNIVGNGSVEGDGDYVVNTVANLIATPTVHNRFVDWKNGDLVVSTDKEYSITVTDNITLTATFEQIPQYTITTSVNDSKMGTVTEGGTYYEGTKVTLTAKANGGYVFVNWSDGNIEETRTIEVTSDLNLTANFKVATPRAWAYALNMVEDGEDYKFSFTATSAGNATIIFTDEDGNTIAPTQAVVGAVTAGENKTVNIAKTQFTGTKDIYWSVKVDGAPIEKMAEITDPSLGIYDIVAPQGIAIDNNTDSEYFGQVYVAAATDGEVSRGTQTRGIFVYNPILNELNTPNTGYLPANATLTNTTRQAIHRVAVNPTNSQVAFAYNISGSTAVWSMNPENLAGDAVNLIDGAGITKANSICFDENGILYVMDNANTGTGGKIYKIQNGVGDVFADAQAGNLWAVEDNAMTSDGRGGLWIAQNRWSVDGYPVLSHVNSNGQVDFAVSQNSSAELQALFPYDDNNASYRGQCAYYVAEDILAFAGNKEAVLFKITYDANDVPTNLEKLMSTGKLGTNIDGLAFDYAGDLYVASENTKRFYKFVVPTNNNTCTVPAPKSQVIQKETRYIVTVKANPAEGGTVSVSDGGNAVEGATLEVTATANTGYRFVNWTKDAEEVSTSASFEYTVPAEDVTLVANFEALPEIVYELNGGVWNKYGWTSKKDMYNALLDDWRAYSGSTRTNVTYEAQLGIGKSKDGIPTTITSVDDRVALMDLFTDATYAPKWGWLATYVDAVAVAQSKTTQPTTSAGHFTYALGNFFGEDNANATNWMGAVDFTGEEAHITAFAPYWGQTFPLPTQPTEEIVLNAPYKEGYEFDGWYANSDFSGAEITVVDETTNGTLYAKWLEHFYTRTVTNGYFGTICLPYGSNNYSGAEFYEIAYLELEADGTTPKGIWLDEVTGALEAGKPYIFKATSNLLTVNYEGAEVLNPIEGKAGLTGTFTLIQDIETSDPSNTLEGNYMISGNQFWLCGAGCWLNANRAYINKDILHSNTTPIAEIPGRRRVSMGAAGENTTTGVNNLTEGGAIAPNVEGTYDVLGRKFTEPNGTGFYIVNGKKVVIVK